MAPVELVDGQDLFWWGARTASAFARLRVRLGAFTLLLVAALTIVACGDDDSVTAGDAARATSLRVEVVPAAGAPAQTATLICGRAPTATGFIVDAAAACELVGEDERARGRLVDGPTADRACTQIYGGPQEAHLTGALDGPAHRCHRHPCRRLRHRRLDVARALVGPTRLSDHTAYGSTLAPSAACTRQPSTAAPESVRATTHPPKPAPVSRAPQTPGVRLSRSTSASSSGVDTSKSSRRLTWLAYIASPAVVVSPVRNASANVRTRWFSRHDMACPSAKERLGQPVGVVERRLAQRTAEGALGGFALGPSFRIRAAQPARA